jgi:integrase
VRTAIAKRPNGKWRARWVDPATGKERAQHFDRKVDAQQFLDRIRGEYASGTYVDPKAGRVTFGDYAERWRAAQFHRPSTSVQLSGHLKRHVLPFFGHRQLASIRKSEVQAWVKGRSADLGPATVEVVFRWVSSIFRAAVDDGLLRSSPCRGVTLPRKDRERLRPPTLEQMEALVDAVPDRYRALLVFAAGTGVRQGEAFGLTADRVDFLRRRVTIDRQLVQLPQKAPVLAPPKTDASRRIVPLPQVVLDALAEHLRKIALSNCSVTLSSWCSPMASTTWILRRPASTRCSAQRLNCHLRSSQ